MCKSCYLVYIEENEIEFFILLEMTVNGYLYKMCILSYNTMKLQQVFTILC